MKISTLQRLKALIFLALCIISIPTNKNSVEDSGLYSDLFTHLDENTFSKDLERSPSSKNNIEIDCSVKEIAVSHIPFRTYCRISNLSPTPLKIQSYKMEDPSANCKFEVRRLGELEKPLPPHQTQGLYVLCQIDHKSKTTSLYSKKINFVFKQNDGNLVEQSVTISGYLKTKMPSTNLVTQENAMIWPEWRKLRNHEDSCESIELEKKGYSLENVPYTAQVNGNCYAHAISQLYDAWRNMNNDSNRNKYSSPMDIAYQLSTQTPNKTSIKGGGIQFIEMLMKTPPCPRTLSKRYSSESKAFVENLEYNFQKLADKLAKFRMDQEIELNTPASRYQGDSLNFKKDFNKVIGSCINCNKYNYNESFDIVQKENQLKVAQKQMSQTCSQSETLNTRHAFRVQKNIQYLYEVALGANTPENFISNQKVIKINSIHDELNKGIKALPIGMSFCSKFLFEGKNTIIRGSNFEEIRKDCGTHAVIISGRRKNPASGKCEFKIRNSWGDCKSVSKDFDCNNKTSESWVDSFTLSKYLIETNTLIKY